MHFQAIFIRKYILHIREMTYHCPGCTSLSAMVGSVFTFLLKTGQRLISWCVYKLGERGANKGFIFECNHI